MVRVLNNDSFFSSSRHYGQPGWRFILVADGYEDKSYLSALLMEIDENPD